MGCCSMLGIKTQQIHLNYHKQRQPQLAKAQPKNHRTGESNHQLSNQNLKSPHFRVTKQRERENIGFFIYFFLFFLF